MKNWILGVGLLKSIIVFAVIVSLCLTLISQRAFASNISSISLNGTNQYLSISDASQTGLDLTGDFTIEVWVKPASQPSGDAYYIVGKYDFDNNHRSYALSYTAAQQLSCSISANGSSASSATFSQTLSTGTWYHVAAVYTSSSGNCEIFVNGSSIGSSTTVASGAYNGAGAFTVGGLLGNSPGFFFHGKIDDVRVYNVARSQASIAGDYQQELTGSESNLVSYWELNNSLSDSTSSGNTLTNNNSATYSTSDVPFDPLTDPTIQSFTADPATITSGNSSLLSWEVTNATSLSIDNGVGVVTGTSTSVSPMATTTYTITASNEGYATSTAQVTVTVNASPTAVRKSATESVVSSTALQNDDHLSLQLFSGKTYIVEGLIIASTTSGTPDIKIAFTSPASTEMTIGYTAVAGSATSGGMLQSASASGRISLPANTPVPIVIRGTMLAGNTGTLRLQWAQFTSNGSAVQVAKGSYLKVTEI